jgi:selenocysteine-specific elongation factor
MLAGASGIDLVLLVIEAGEGVMPQTREHFEICRLLGIKTGIVVLTKTDLVDADTVELARLDAVELVAGSFLENAPVVRVSAKTGDGIEDLRDQIVRISHELPSRDDALITRLPIDPQLFSQGVWSGRNGDTGFRQIDRGSRARITSSRTSGACSRFADARQRGQNRRGGAAGSGKRRRH